MAMETVERKGNMDDQMGNMKELSTQYSLMLNLLENLENPKQFRNSQHLRLRFGLSGVPHVHRDASKHPWPVQSALKLLDFVRILWMGLSLLTGMAVEFTDPTCFLRRKLVTLLRV